MSVRCIQLCSRHNISSFNKVKLPAIRTFCTESKKNDIKSDDDIQKKIDDIVKSEKLVVFMKGTPAEPSCGFSNAVVRILEMHGIENYFSINVLENESMRSGVKNYSQWATIPQVFIGGEFVGGCDIMMELHKSGDLIEQLERVGLKSVLKDV